MTAKASDEGLLIPKELLGTATEFEIRREGERLIVEPAQPLATKTPLTDEEYANDPIWNLGKNPVDIGITDASVNLDRYLADEACGHSS
jgi:virulence-associated protein VagC